MSVLDEIVKAYDIRGTVPDQLNAEVARAFGVAFASPPRAGPRAEPTVLVARDMRPSGRARRRLHRRRARPGRRRHRHRAGVVGPPLLRRRPAAAAGGDLPPPRTTRPVQRRQAVPRRRLPRRPRRPRSDQAADQRRPRRARPGAGVAAGRRTEANLLADFVEHVCRSSTSTPCARWRVVADTANGMGGLVVPAVFDRLGVFELEVMYPSSTARSRTTRPTRCSRPTSTTCGRVVSGGFDIGLAFDGDADRVFVVDETGAGLSGSTTTAMLGGDAAVTPAPRSCTT